MDKKSKIIICISLLVIFLIISSYVFYNISATQKDIIVFGNYYKDDGDHLENLEWQVLKNGPRKTTLITKDIIDCVSFDYEEQGHSYSNYWYFSNIRSWLNNDFYNLAFSQEEKDMILTQNLYNTYDFDKNNYGQHYKDQVASDYHGDNVYLLTYDEAKWLYNNNEARKAYATPYARSKGIQPPQKVFNRYDEPVVVDEDNNGEWWIIRYNTMHSISSGVFTDGSMIERHFLESFTPHKYSFERSTCGVRPVITVDTKKLDQYLYDN